MNALLIIVLSLLIIVQVAIFVLKLLTSPPRKSRKELEADVREFDCMKAYYAKTQDACQKFLNANLVREMLIHHATAVIGRGPYKDSRIEEVYDEFIAAFNKPLELDDKSVASSKEGYYRNNYSEK